MTTQIIDRVIQGDYCIGCGLCAAMAPEDFDLSFTPEGMFRSTPLRPAAEREQDLSTLCPMSGTGPDDKEPRLHWGKTVPVAGDAVTVALPAVSLTILTVPVS